MSVQNLIKRSGWLLTVAFHSVDVFQSHTTKEITCLFLLSLEPSTATPLHFILLPLVYVCVFVCVFVCVCACLLGAAVVMAAILKD